LEHLWPLGDERSSIQGEMSEKPASEDFAITIREFFEARERIVALEKQREGDDKALVLVADSLKSQIGTAIMFIKALGVLMFLVLGALTALLGILGLVLRGHT
jgi:hypothetical protein